MLKLTLIAALAGVAFISAAAAQDMRAQANGYGGWGYKNGYNIDSGVNRYCPPGFIPHSYPNGNGVRCESANGDYQFDSAE